MNRGYAVTVAGAQQPCKLIKYGLLNCVNFLMFYKIVSECFYLCPYYVAKNRVTSYKL